MATFFCAAFLLSWTAWIGAAGIQAPGPRALLVLLGTFAPGIVALCLTGWTHGESGIRDLLRRLLLWKVQARWYVFAISYVIVIKLAVATAHRVVTGTCPAFGQEPWHLMIAATLGSTLLGGQAGEELGWRGYALPRLAAQFGLAVASLVLGVLWAAWHLPLHDAAGKVDLLHLLLRIQPASPRHQRAYGHHDRSYWRYNVSPQTHP